MNQEIKDYIDSKFDFIYKLLDVCELCKKGVYKIAGSARNPLPMKCNNCGKNKECLVAKVELMNTNQPT